MQKDREIISDIQSTRQGPRLMLTHRYQKRFAIRVTAKANYTLIKKLYINLKNARFNFKSNQIQIILFKNLKNKNIYII